MTQAGSFCTIREVATSVPEFGTCFSAQFSREAHSSHRQWSIPLAQQRVRTGYAHPRL